MIEERTIVTKDNDGKFLKLVQSSENDGNVASVFENKESVYELTDADKNSLIQEAAFALMKRWFPNRLPTGDDYKKWTEISLEDATAVVEHFINEGIFVGEIEK